MRFTPSIVASAALLSTANAAIKGFNYGAQFNNDAAKTLTDFEYEFNNAKTLPGTDGWTSARLYTMIQHGTQSTIIEAIQAAINTKTTLLLGLWASAGQDSFNNEVNALKAAISQYGTAFTDLVVGISVGSEDLYRISADGAGGNPGTGPDVLVSYIKQVRDAIAGTSLSSAKLGHVDTWQVYVNASNSAVIDNLDWIGMDAYPYFQSSFANGIGNGGDLFFDAYNQTVAATKGKPVWVTETGWPVSGETVNQAVPSADNARIYWEDVTCKLVNDNVNLYYYTLQDVQWGNPSPSFGLKPGGDLAQVSPLFDLSCPAAAKNSDPFNIRSNGYVARLSPTLSTVFVFDVRSENRGKTCNLAFYMPPAFPWQDISPVKIRSPGGIIVSSVGQQSTSADISASNIVSTGVVGWVPSVQPANQYNLASFPCAAEQKVAYQIESAGGLTMDFFQMTVPPLGLFMSVS
ncbi:glycoside hydrolase family 17 protein [Didymella exigua CBS 183.55]|uniref:Probable glucan endo-1,3-beta-glucosidase eglC n=1 Tax=Didymella exigua CBS 183.55 TaxID=1150837 RepID=A0A6A5RGK5_9PLEO|nr:glycoside hydrolase family 17 protein [Didymella exigua CBS 183.55]KAF1926872.1 glycoside hydrolase family 17 protein [Didymella exigua CBS 183.55]